MDNLIVIENNKKRVLTTKQLAEVYECSETQIQQNFNNNTDKFIKDKHYYLLQGEELRDFKRNLDNIEVAPNVNKLYLWTERGANRHCKILDTEKAWEQFDSLEETYFSVKENKPTCIEDVLIQSLQEMKDMRLQIQETKQQTAAVKQELQDVREVIVLNPKENWREETNKLVKKVCMKLGDYQKPKDELYKALEERGTCDLKVRLKNMRGRVMLNGSSKSKADGLNYLDVIAEDKKLIEIYTALVKEMAIKYKIA